MGTTLDITKTQKGPVKVWFGIALPAPGTTMILNALGEPDATQNPLRKLVGLTDAGASSSLGKTTTEENFDELPEAQNFTIDKTTMNIKVEAAQVLDPDNLAQATTGIGTPTIVAGRTIYTIGTGVLSYTGVAVIAPTLYDPTKCLVFHMYKGYNAGSFDVETARNKRAKISFDFKGVGVATRVKSDTLGYVDPGMPLGI